MPPKKKETTEVKTYQIPAYNRASMLCTIVGHTQLAQNRMTDATLDDIIGKQTRTAAAEQTAKRTKPPRNPEAECKAKRHQMDSKGRKFGHPANGVRLSMIAAGGRFADHKFTHLRGLFTVTNEDGNTLCEIKSKSGWKLVRGSGKPSGSSVLQVFFRPHWEDWQMRIRIDFIEDLISADQVVNLLNLAGMSVGIGAGRPECNGSNGTFSVDLGTIKIKRYKAADVSQIAS